MIINPILTMKHYFITLLFCACFSLSAQEEDEGKYTEEQLEAFGGTLQGRVKSVERIYYSQTNLDCE